MARKRVYNTNRFDGGMTDSPRDTSNLTKMAYISHLDIYRDPNRMFVMPGYESVNGYDGDPVGIKDFDMQDIAMTGGANDVLFALGRKADGTGWKMFQKSSTETEWKDITLIGAGTVEGTKNLPLGAFLIGELPGDLSSAFFPVYNSGSTSGFIDMARLRFDGYSDSWSPSFTLFSAETGGARMNYAAAPNDTFYFWTRGRQNLHRITSTAVTADNKTTALGVYDVTAGDYTVGIAGSNSRRGARNLLWDNASLLADQNNSLGRGEPWVVGHQSSIFSFVVSEYATAGERNTFFGNGRPRVAIKALLGEAVETLYTYDAFTNAGNLIYNTQGYWRNAMTWYARTSENTGGTSFRQGIWALGRGEMDAQMGVSILLDTSSLGSVFRTRWIGNTAWFINHSGDGSVSRLQRFDTGTYDVPATIETLIYGADSPYLKELNGISIVTENLPAGGSVVVSYRKDEDDAWTTMGTSDTAGKQKHNFTKANGTPIGRFQEIQFRIVVTGKTAVKNIMVAVTETDDLSF